MLVVLLQGLLALGLVGGFMAVHVRIYPRYSISTAQDFDLGALLHKPTYPNLVRTNLKWSRWSSRLALVIDSKSS